MEEEISEEERKALRGSKFAPLPPPPRFSNQPRLAHPGGPLMTNKAAALSKFLERKLQHPNGLDSINPDLLQLALQNAKHNLSSGSSSKSGRVIRHVDSFGDPEALSEDEKVDISQVKKLERKKKKDKKKKKKQITDDDEHPKLKKRKKKLKL